MSWCLGGKYLCVLASSRETIIIVATIKIAAKFAFPRGSYRLQLDGRLLFDILVRVSKVQVNKQGRRGQRHRADHHQRPQDRFRDHISRIAARASILKDTTIDPDLPGSNALILIYLSHVPTFPLSNLVALRASTFLEFRI